jgi:hypothetical protein
MTSSPLLSTIVCLIFNSIIIIVQSIIVVFLSAQELLQCISSSKSDVTIVYYTGVTEASSGSWVSTSPSPHIIFECFLLSSLSINGASQVLPDCSLVTFLDIVQVT